ncbi:aminopeptidase Q [Eublepharis macularius]|uniref:Aminopeptidase n=1 Tax=Eublepharis macularius TaxID=481883 RepID=A0AA97JUS2_EUBMA|nr:aminopeptidase Q [Eublepharis macularius]
MGARSPSGFYVGRRAAALLALLLAALLVALLVLAVLYGRSLQRLADERLRKGSDAAPPTPSVGPSPASARPPGPWDRLRLPAALVPLHYSLLLWPHLAPGLPEPRTFSGWVNITVRCRQETTRVLLHSHQLAYSSTAVWGPLAGPRLGSGANASRVPLAELWLAERHQFAVLELRERLRAGALYELRLAFDGLLFSEGAFRGLFCSAYEDQGERRWLVASLLQPADARRVYPCFDEPAMKATFNISIVHHPSYVALSNMPAIDVSEYKDVNESKLSMLSNWSTPSNWTVTTFKTTPKMSTYITAFVVCNFDYVTRTVRGNEIRIWAQKDEIRDGCADYALNITGPIFSFMEEFLNISYPLSKTDLIALPDLGAGAMENWGLITFQKESLLYCPQDKFTGMKIVIRQIVCHEIVHQWFGNLVTMDWWNDLWLNEGFATYFEYLCADYIESSVPVNKIFSSNVLLPMLRMDDAMLPWSLSGSEETKETDSLLERFNLYTYKKGASILRMLSSFISEKLFIKALNLYLNEFSFANAIQDDLWNHIQKVIDEQTDLQLPAPIKVIMDSWTCQPGFPLLTVNLSTGNISQEQFYDEKDKNDTSISNNTWIIPISWIRNGTVQPLVWLDKKSEVFPEMKISDSEYDWIILNANMNGYYRVNYGQFYWRRLAKILESDPKAIPVVNRLQLLDDAFELKRSGHTEYDTPLYLTKYLEKEDEILIWSVVLTKLEFTNAMNILSDYKLYPVLKKFFLTRISPIYHHYANLLRQSFEVFAVDYYTKVAIESILRIACSLGFRDCLELASEIFTKWMDNPKYEIPPCISTTICCYGIQMGGDKEWDIAWKKYISNDFEINDNYAVFPALACTREPWILQRYLQYTLNDSIISPDQVSEVIGSVAATEVGHRIAWNFLTENWLVLSKRHGSEPLLNFLETTQHFITTDLQIQMVQVFLNNTLTEEERIAPNDILLAAKSKNKERKKVITETVKWLQKNMDG